MSSDGSFCPRNCVEPWTRSVGNFHRGQYHHPEKVSTGLYVLWKRPRCYHLQGQEHMPRLCSGAGQNIANFIKREKHRSPDRCFFHACILPCIRWNDMLPACTRRVRNLMHKGDCICGKLLPLCLVCHPRLLPASAAGRRHGLCPVANADNGIQCRKSLSLRHAVSGA